MADIDLVEGQHGGDWNITYLDSDGNPQDFTGFNILELYINDITLITFVKQITLTTPQSGQLVWSILDGDVPPFGKYKGFIRVRDSNSNPTRELPAIHFSIEVIQRGKLA